MTSFETAVSLDTAVPGTSPLHVTSETGALRQVVVHTPGEEMALVSPARKDALLFDDLLFVDDARTEHAVMCRLVEAVVGQPDAVLQIGTLLRESFDAPDARASFVETLVRLMPERNFEAYHADLLALDPDGLYRFAATGQAPFSISADPVPNLLFTRDPAAVVGEHAILSHAATAARMPESAIVNTIYRYHPRFAGAADRLITVPDDVFFEGGDLLVVSETLAMIGQSERPSLGGVMHVAQQLLERTAIEHVVMVNLPKERYCMHLDTVFTFADDETCVVFPPIIEDANNQTFHLEAGDEPGRFRMRVLPSVRTALDELTGRAHTFVPCGGHDPVSQRREQWTDGANLFALRPGIVVGYERNRRTYEALEEVGFETLDAHAFLEQFPDAASVPTGRRIAIRLTGNELSRGRGGPRCMTMPLSRGSGQ